MVHLAVRMCCNWPTDHAIDHSSIGLNRLTIQLVFNEVSMFTFSGGTHGVDIRVLKNYLKTPCGSFMIIRPILSYSYRWEFVYTRMLSWRHFAFASNWVKDTMSYFCYSSFSAKFWQNPDIQWLRPIAGQCS